MKGKPSAAALERFWAFVDRSGECWTWKGRRNPLGYGHFWYEGQTWRATRWIYEATIGPILAGMVVCHKCDNPPCVRPDHLFLGTQQENARDMEAKGRSTNQRQHVDLFRKKLLRTQLLRNAVPGPVYVPYCGDGDLALELYRGRRTYAADIDPARVAVYESRIPDCEVRVADCDTWPFAGVTAAFAVADFDAYAYPYESFRAFWTHAKKARRLVLFFTDAQRQAIWRTGYFRTPDGAKMSIKGVAQKGGYANFWLKRYCEPWIREAIRPMRVITVRGYLRGMMLYWGVVCER